jgi:hypothetical protein
MIVALIAVMMMMMIMTKKCFFNKYCNEHLISSIDFDVHSDILLANVICRLTSPQQSSLTCLPVAKLVLPTHKQDNDILPSLLFLLAVSTSPYTVSPS